MKTIGHTTESVIADMEKRPDANHPIWGEPLPAHPDIPLVRLTDAEAIIRQQEETIKRMDEALEMMLHAVCGETGFAAAVRANSGHAYPWPALDEAEDAARAARKEQP